MNVRYDCALGVSLSFGTFSRLDGRHWRHKPLRPLIYNKINANLMFMMRGWQEACKPL